MGVRTDRLAQKDGLRRGGMAGYLLPFEIISIHLVVVLIGAAYLARATAPRGPTAGHVRGRRRAQALNYLLNKT